jgi:uncharacterized protein YndB with AHSA1/START domain
MEGLSFDQFTKKIYIKASIEKLYWCWATEEGFKSWFLREAIFERENDRVNANEYIKPDDKYTWKWHNWDGQEEGKVIEANGRDKVVLSFAGDCRVTILLEQVNDSVLLSLTQANIPTDEKSKLEIHFGCSNGWIFWLANLKAKLEHGITLNETEFDLTNNPLAGWEFVNM